MMKEREESAVSVVGRLAGRLILMSVAVLVLYLCAGYAFDFGKSIFYQKPVEQPPGTDVTIKLEKGCGYDGLASALMKKGVIADELAVAVQARLYKVELMPGDYTVNTSNTTKEILASISRQTEQKKEEQEALQKEKEDVLGAGDEGGESEETPETGADAGTGADVSENGKEDRNGSAADQ